ncbi:MAG: Panacea domain-containing protein [Myxococcota bacterium]
MGHTHFISADWEERSSQLLLYLADRLEDDANFSMTKVYKLFYFIDKEAYLRTGSTVTGSSYLRFDHGPVPRNLHKLRAKLEDTGAVEIVYVDRGKYTQHRLRAWQRPQLRFSEDEMTIIDQVIERLRPMTAKKVSDLSHEEPGWKLAGDGEVIPHEAWCVDEQPTVLTPELESWARSVINR